MLIFHTGCVIPFSQALQISAILNAILETLDDIETANYALNSMAKMMMKSLGVFCHRILEVLLTTVYI